MDCNAFAQALQTPKTYSALNEWMDKRLDVKLNTKWDERFEKMNAKWEEKIEKMDAKWEERFEKMDAKWHALFDQMNLKLDSKLELVEFLKVQNKSQTELLIKLQGQLDAKNEEIISILKGKAAK